MSLLGRLHGDHVHVRRVQVLSRQLAEMLPRRARVLDVGCGDGALAAAIQQLRPDVEIAGIDVLVRERTHIPVARFDGTTIPYPDASVDVVMFVDVLHHADDPAALLGEGVRAARTSVVIKDHTLSGVLAGTTLRFMDWVGNARHGVALPYHYWTRPQWHEAWKQLGLTLAVWRSDLNIYPWPATYLFDRSLHFVARLDVLGPTDRRPS